MVKEVLVLGSSGRFGRASSEAFEKSGWTVRHFDRKRDDLKSAASAVDVIVNAWNPPYDRWEKEVPGLTSAVIDAARQNEATVLIPGNVYVFGKTAPERFAADTPHQATNTLGRVRIEMEDAYRQSGVRTIILRAGDFIDTGASGNWFDKVITAKLAAGKLVYPGDPDVPHAWAWLPDAAAAAVSLAEIRGSLSNFEDVPFPGYTLTGRDLAEHVGAVLERQIAVKRLNWLPLFVAAPFWKMGRHLLEMRYLWSKPHFLDGARFSELLPDFEATPVERALAAALGAINVNPDEPMP